MPQSRLHHLRALVYVVAGASALAGCHYQLRPGEVQPLTAPVAGAGDPAARHAVWERAIEVLLDEGYVPSALDETAGYISAHQRDDVAIGGLDKTLAIVLIKPDGQVRVEVAGTGVYTSSGSFIDAINDVQKRLVTKIVGAAGAMPPAAAPPAPGAPPAPRT